MNDMNGYLQAAELGASEGNSDLTQLQNLAEQQANAEREVAELEAKLTKAKERHKHVSESLLPEAMERCGLSEFKSATGLQIKIKEDVRASIPKQREALAFQWLREHNHGSLIKRSISLSFGRGEDERAKLLGEKLEELGFEEYDDKTTVHPQTLKAFVVNELAEGNDIPQELFGVHRQRKAVIQT